MSPSGQQHDDGSEEADAHLSATISATQHPHVHAILSAISSSAIEQLSSLLEQSSSDEAEKKAYPSPSREHMLGFAASQNQPLALSYLLRRSPSKEDVTPGLLRACSQHIECYKALIEIHPHALQFGLGHVGDIFGGAALDGNLEFMRYMANEKSWNIDINESEIFHRPTLQYLAEYGKIEVLRCMLTECAPERLRVRETDAIRAAIRGRNMDNLRCLLEHAPEGTKAVVDGWPVKESKYEFEVKERRERGWDVPNLHYAANVGNTEAIQILLDAGADVGLRDGEGKTAKIGTLVRNRKAVGSRCSIM
ncbi:ANK-REP-region domain-containing protein [Favolaschia claudopus]|uniref:ANK-REP-region domain-containing protein n=1 Tax=Favolaschia claudopus TaxID=2862362 RepID=A0AAW0CPH8_9AGAR